MRLLPAPDIVPCTMIALARLLVMPLLPFAVPHVCAASSKHVFSYPRCHLHKRPHKRPES